MNISEDGSFIALSLLEGEEIVGLVSHDGFLYVKTNLDRYFKSTQAPVEHIDFVEVT